MLASTILTIGIFVIAIIIVLNMIVALVSIAYGLSLAYQAAFLSWAPQNPTRENKIYRDMRRTALVIVASFLCLPVEALLIHAIGELIR